ncbi:MAG: cytidine deaminase [Nitrospirae bacterium]|nr:cytidine deaminase [Nitrospirota bacterium]
MRLIRMAEKAMGNAIAPYSKFKVGVAIIAKNGKIYSGCNIENASLALSVCAERVAILNALSNGERSFKAMAIVANDRDYCYPCGACRQLLWDFAKNLEIYLKSEMGVKKFTIKEFLPYAFSKDFA